MSGERFPFTIRELERLALPATGRAVYYDETVPGLSLRVSSSGVKSFTVHGRARGGRPERVTLGRYPNMSIERARQEAKAVVASWAEGDSKADQVRRKRQERTVGEIAAAYFTDREHAGKRSVAEMRMSFELYLGALPTTERKAHARERRKPSGAVNWHSRRLTEIQPDDVRRVRTELAGGCGRHTANRTMQLWRAIVNFARKHGYVEDAHGAQLVAAVEMYAEPARTRRLNGEEIRRFFAALTSEENENFRDLLSVLLFTGARRMNTLAMRWDELDLEARTWEIPAGKAKAGQPIVLPLSGGALEVLRRRQQERAPECAFVFPADSESGHMEAPKKPWAAFRKRAELADLRLHDVRRTLGSWMVDTGATLAVIGKQLGHRDQKSTAIYARLDVEPVRAAVERAEQAMRGAAATPATSANVVPLPTRRGRRQ
ncbi:MAG: site-specific integrase [Burkholderiales bacterium]